MRIAPQHDAGIEYHLDKKFGCRLDEARKLLLLAKDLGLVVKGVRCSRKYKFTIFQEFLLAKILICAVILMSGKVVVES